MPEITIVQFMRPNGRQVRHTAFVSDEAFPLVQEIEKAGYRFEAEVLMNGLVSQTVSNADADIAIKLSPNGPEVNAAREALIREAVAIIRDHERLAALTDS